jgi:hypothetical protein
MNTLEALKSGTLKNAKSIKLACNLTEFPQELFGLADTLEILDMTDNALSSLPENFNVFKKLRILFLSNNNFTQFPTILAQCPNLTMIGFRNNHIHSVPENAFPLNIQWLILTDNVIEKLPKSTGDLTKLQKCMLSGNKLSSLPKTMRNCHNLELLRISVNQFTSLPQFLLDLPKLSWLAYGGNPFCDKHPSCDTALKEIAWNDVALKEILGEGASGLISKAIYKDEEVAVKVFKGDITSDGLPQEEMDINISMGQHPHLVDVLAKVTGHPEGKDVLMLELIPSSFFNLGLPPTFQTCSRDVYPDALTLTLTQTLKILTGMASAALHMHERGIMHGDFYAHNIMIDKKANSILGDFGGASYYAPKEIEVHQSLERLEVRAFGYLTDELLRLCKDDTPTLMSKLLALKASCLSLKNKERPLFLEIHKHLLEIN